MSLKDFSKIYFVVLLGHLVFLYVNQDPKLISFTKPLIVFTLLAFYHNRVAQEGKIRILLHRYFALGLVFSLAGDVALLYTQTSAFYLGMGLFAGAHFCYIRSFLGDVDLKSGTLKKHPWFVLLPLLTGVVALWYLWPHLAEARWPVVFYTLVISALFLSILNRFGRMPNKFLFAGLLGALLFMASNFLLAQKLFVETFPHAQMWIMTTYSLAQFGLVVMRIGVGEEESETSL